MEASVTIIDRGYYRRRITEERARQAAATSPSAAQAHAELAKHYEQLLRLADGKGAS